jgi:hypothetical protein
MRRAQSPDQLITHPSAIAAGGFLPWGRRGDLSPGLGFFGPLDKALAANDALQLLLAAQVSMNIFGDGPAAALGASHAVFFTSSKLVTLAW